MQICKILGYICTILKECLNNLQSTKNAKLLPLSKTKSVIQWQTSAPCAEGPRPVLASLTLILITVSRCLRTALSFANLVLFPDAADSTSLQIILSACLEQ